MCREIYWKSRTGNVTKCYEKPLQLESRTSFVFLKFAHRMHLNTFSVVPALNTKYVPVQTGYKVNKLHQFQFIKGKTDYYFEPCPLPFFSFYRHTAIFRSPSSLGLLHGDITELRLVKPADVGSHPFSIMLRFCSQYQKLSNIYVTYTRVQISVAKI